MPHSSYLHRMPRVPHYQTTPFTIDPSARSTQTFAERYGVSPPHSNENIYGNDYTIVGSQHDDKCSDRHDASTENHKVELSKAPSSSTIIPQQMNNNNNNGNEGENASKAFKSTVIKDPKNAPNIGWIEHSFQVSDDVCHFPSSALIDDAISKWKSLLNYIASHSPHHLCQKQFFESLMRNETCFQVQNAESFSQFFF